MSTLSNSTSNDKSMNGLVIINANSISTDEMDVDTLVVNLDAVAPTVGFLSNDTHIATTAWVTSHASGSYVTLSGTQTISGEKSFSNANTFISGNTVTNSIQSSGATQNTSLFTEQSSGALNIGTLSTRSGGININAGSTSTAAVNISSTTTANAPITIGSTASAAQIVQINGANITVGGTGTTNLALQSAPASNILFGTDKTGGGIYFGMYNSIASTNSMNFNIGPLNTGQINFGTGASAKTITLGCPAATNIISGSNTITGLTNLNTSGILATNIGNTTGILALTGSTNTILGTTNLNTTGILATSIGNSTGALALTGGTNTILGTTNLNTTGILATNIGNSTGALALTGGTNTILGTTNVNTTVNSNVNIGSVNSSTQKLLFHSQDFKINTGFLPINNVGSLTIGGANTYLNSTDTTCNGNFNVSNIKGISGTTFGISTTGSDNIDITSGGNTTVYSPNLIISTNTALIFGNTAGTGIKYTNPLANEFDIQLINVADTVSYEDNVGGSIFFFRKNNFQVDVPAAFNGTAAFTGDLTIQQDTYPPTSTSAIGYTNSATTTTDPMTNTVIARSNFILPSKGVWLVVCGYEWTSNAGNVIESKHLILSTVSGSTTPGGYGLEYFEEINDSAGAASPRQIGCISGVIIATASTTIYVNARSQVASGTNAILITNVSWTRLG